MNNTIRTVFGLWVSLFCLSGCTFGAVPASLESDLRALERRLKGGVSNQWRVELHVVPSGVHLDPPPTRLTFRARAGINFGVSVNAYRPLDDAISQIRSSSWGKVRSLSPGGGRWFWRVVDDEGNALLELLVEEELSQIGYQDEWYKVDKKLVALLTRDFVAFAHRRTLHEDH